MVKRDRSKALKISSGAGIDGEVSYGRVLGPCCSRRAFKMDFVSSGDCRALQGCSCRLRDCDETVRKRSSSVTA